MNTRHSPSRRSSRRSPSTSQRRSPPSSIACTIARSRSVRSAAINASTSAGSRIRGRRRTPRTSGTDPAVAAMTALARRQAPRHRIRRHLAPGDQIAIETRHRSQSALDRRRRQPRAAIRDPHDVLRARTRPLLGATKYNTSRDVTSAGSFSTIEKKTVRSCAYARTVAGPRTPMSELQELVDLIVTHTPRPITTGAHHAPEQRGPHDAHLPIGPTHRRRVLRWSAQVADHPCKCRSVTGPSRVRGPFSGHATWWDGRERPGFDGRQWADLAGRSTPLDRVQ